MSLERAVLKSVVQAEWQLRINRDPNTKPFLVEQLGFYKELLDYYDSRVVAGLEDNFDLKLADEVIRQPGFKGTGIPFLPDAKIAIIEAGNYAFRFRHQHVEPRHLLLSLTKHLREQELLSGFGVTYYEELFEAVKGTDVEGRIINPNDFSYHPSAIVAIEQAALILNHKNWGSVGARGLMLGLLETNTTAGMNQVYDLIKSVGKKDPRSFHDMIKEKFRDFPEVNSGKP